MNNQYLEERLESLPVEEWAKYNINNAYINLAELLLKQSNPENEENIKAAKIMLERERRSPSDFHDRRFGVYT